MDDELIINRLSEVIAVMRRPGRSGHEASEIDRRRYRGEARRTLARLRALPRQDAQR